MSQVSCMCPSVLPCLASVLHVNHLSYLSCSLPIFSSTRLRSVDPVGLLHALTTRVCCCFAPTVAGCCAGRCGKQWKYLRAVCYYGVVREIRWGSVNPCLCWARPLQKSAISSTLWITLIRRLRCKSSCVRESLFSNDVIVESNWLTKHACAVGSGTRAYKMLRCASLLLSNPEQDLCVTQILQVPRNGQPPW